MSLREKGRITLPAEIRNALGITRGDQLEIRAENGAVVLKPIRTVTSKEIKGILGRMKVSIEEAEDALGRENV